jgi:hypothetical protein
MAVVAAAVAVAIAGRASLGAGAGRLKHKLAQIRIPTQAMRPGCMPGLCSKRKLAGAGLAKNNLQAHSQINHAYECSLARNLPLLYPFRISPKHMY